MTGRDRLIAHACSVGAGAALASPALAAAATSDGSLADAAARMVSSPTWMLGAAGVVILLLFLFSLASRGARTTPTPTRAATATPGARRDASKSTTRLTTSATLVAARTAAVEPSRRRLDPLPAPARSTETIEGAGARRRKFVSSREPKSSGSRASARSLGARKLSVERRAVIAHREKRKFSDAAESAKRRAFTLPPGRPTSSPFTSSRVGGAAE
jgi:hypothetical protein